jgi:hypothetical protein
VTLVVRGAFPRNVFELLGTNENSATYALGWALDSSPSLAKLLINKIAERSITTEDRLFRLQTHAEDKGFTDMEIRCGNELHVILEAKIGWQVPAESQLRRYRPRLDSKGMARSKLALVSISAATSELALRRLPKEIDGVRVQHLSWGAVRALAKSALESTINFEERLWLRELIKHLGEYAAMDRVRDNLVYVVSLGSAPMRNDGKHTWIDVVEKDGSYFHPVGNHWPSHPPNYVAFRYHGKVQSVHRIESYDILSDVATRNPLWCNTDTDHFVYKLGPAMRPPKELAAATKEDSIKRSLRVWCAIDTLLSGTFNTLGEARDATKKRLADAEAGKD